MQLSGRGEIEQFVADNRQYDAEQRKQRGLPDRFSQGMRVPIGGSLLRAR